MIRRSRGPKRGKYKVKNRSKYVGKYPIIYRSGWELKYMQMLDEDKRVIRWASEAFKIPYYNVLTKKISNYVPDFFVETKNKKEIIEIKPRKESFLHETRSTRDRTRYYVNMEKWKSAREFCKKKGFGFRVITEGDGYFGR